MPSGPGTGGTSDPSEEFDSESREEREVAAEAAGDRSDLLSLMGHTYRGELGRTSSWRTRIDPTTNRAVVLTASLFTWTFSNESRLRRVYAPLLSVLIAAWVVRLTVFTSSGSVVVATAAVGAIPGALVLAFVGCFYLTVLALALPRAPRRTKGELGSADGAAEWK